PEGSATLFLTFRGTRDAKVRDRDTRVRVALQGALAGHLWHTYERNLLAERHIRYGGYGGIAYYHISDMYIALFNHFIPCGAYEGAYILNPFYKNKSDVQPDTVHADSHGQSASIFGLAYVLGIQL